MQAFFGCTLSTAGVNRKCTEQLICAQLFISSMCRYTLPIAPMLLAGSSLLALYFRSISAIHNLYLHYTPLIHYLSLLYGKVIATPYLSRIQAVPEPY